MLFDFSRKRSRRKIKIQNLVCVWVQLMRLRLRFSVLFFFFFSCVLGQILLLRLLFMHYSWTVAAKFDLSNNFQPINAHRALFTDPQISLFNNFFIKNRSHGTIHTFKNYFATMFFSFQFQFLVFSWIQTDLGLLATYSWRWKSIRGERECSRERNVEMENN